MHNQSYDADQSREVQMESIYMTGVISSDRSQTYDWSHAYDHSREIPAL
jgi:hypothetical protein